MSKKRGQYMRKELHKLTVEAIKAGRVWASSYALDAIEECDLVLESVIDLALRASIVEVEENFSYKRYKDPTCSIHGITKSGVIVRSVWRYNKNTKWAALINVYFCKSWSRGRIRR
jgi:hypothetical protein